jgi:AraC-like DNA-binding protein
MHSHAQGQVLISTEGRMEVRLPATSIVIGPGTGLWVPGGVPHAAISLDAAAFRGVMVERPHASLLPDRCRAFATTPILLAVVPELSAGRPGRCALASSLLLDELAHRIAPMVVRAPDREPFAALCARVYEDPAAAPELDEAARQAGSTRRTFSRMFRRATGKSWTRWVRDVRIARAAVLLADGARVTDAALAVGYSNPSSFSIAFRRQAGRVPRSIRPTSHGPAKR